MRAQSVIYISAWNFFFKRIIRKLFKGYQKCRYVYKIEFEQITNNIIESTHTNDISQFKLLKDIEIHADKLHWISIIGSVLYFFLFISIDSINNLKKNVFQSRTIFPPEKRSASEWIFQFFLWGNRNRISPLTSFAHHW